ncbi:5-methyltetrahydrofolate--homocysteine methyltransferase [Clostridia bacterium]|nr:5-methyltetrahydrofolate--homocysteine methyltransferase [Clostridia bacterium]
MFNRRLYFDGGMGALLAEGVYPDAESAHLAYADAGAQVIKTNTFSDTSDVRGAVKLAKSAGKLVALDIGPTGQLLQPMGNLSFEDAYELFAEVVRAHDGADMVLIETMSDTYELKAAVLAAKENCKLPVIATVTVDDRGKLLTGADVRGVVAMLEGLGVDALGLNCSQGPSGLLPFVKEMLEYASLPVLVQPNAGVPDHNGAREDTPESFAAAMREIALAGAHMLGGCCGTTPEHIRRLLAATADIPYTPPTIKAHSLASSGCQTAEIGKRPLVIGERLNPTGKKRLKEALLSGDMAYLQREAAAQGDAGADILDVNAGLPNIDEAQTLKNAVIAVQAVSALPLQLDSADPRALEAALRVYNGKAVINSVNGKQSSMDAVFPLAKKYGGVVVALPLDENGVPETSAKRLEIVAKIVENAVKHGVRPKDLLIDGLTLAVSADPKEALVTLETIAGAAAMGLNTVLGVSNVSFGLPGRDEMNAAFLTLALGFGLSAAIVNPSSAPIRRALDAFNALSGFDAGFEGWISRRVDAPVEKKQDGRTLRRLIKSGVAADCPSAARALVKGGTAPLEIIDSEIIPALNDMGDDFGSGRAFLPQLLRSAEAAQAAFDALREFMPEDSAPRKDTVVIATVRGDVHDIGKNIARVLMRNYGYNVIDLGRDVPSEAVVEAVKRHGARYVGLSALMTTTVGAMKDTIAALRAEGLNCRVFVSGAVMTEEYAALVGADVYVSDAMDAMRYMESMG